MNEKTAFGWPVVVTVGACLVAVGGGMVRVDGIQAENARLRDKFEALERAQAQDRSALLQTATLLGEMKGTLNELRDDVRKTLGIRPAGGPQR